MVEKLDFFSLVVLLAKPYMIDFKPVLIDFYMRPTTRRGIAAFVGQVFKNLSDRDIYIRLLIGDGLRR
jgi:hypothetical protein